MRTVKELIEELKKFPEEAHCIAYEGEHDGIVVSMDGHVGFIYCGMKHKEEETELFNEGL